MQTKYLKIALIGLALIGVNIACKEKSEAPVPIVVKPEPSVPADPNKPETPTPPKLKRVVISNTDFQQLEYDDKGRLSKYISQWQYVQSDPSKIQRVENTFEYNASGQLVKVRSQAGEQRYNYQNGILTTIETVGVNGRLISTMFHKFDAQNRLVERREVIAEGSRLPEGPSGTKWEYTYDTKSNCVQEKYWYEEKGQYRHFETITYSDFDDKPNPFNAIVLFPYLPQTVFQTNNPQKQTTVFVETGFGQSISHRYEYDAKGIVTTRSTQRVGGGMLVSRLEY